MDAILWEMADGRWRVLTDNGSGCAGIRPSLEAAREAAEGWGYIVRSIIRLL